MKSKFSSPARKVIKRSPGRTVRRINLPAIFNAPVECESTLERDFVMRAALCPDVDQLKHQPFRIELAGGKTYTPDFFVQSFTGMHRVVEVKMADRVESQTEKFNQARDFLASRGIGFVVLTEQHIRRDRMHMHAMSLLRYSKGGVCSITRERLLQCLGRFDSGLSLSDLASQCNAAMPDILHLVATRQVAVGPGWVFSEDSVVAPITKEKHHEVRIENWFDAALW